METPFGGYQKKQTIKQPDLGLKVINKQPKEIQTTPVSATSQPQNTKTDIQEELY